jgi:hypothetical protein
MRGDARWLNSICWKARTRRANRGGRGVPVRRKATASIAYPGHLRLLLSDRPSRSTDDGLNAVLHVTNDDLALRVALLHSGL